ncbi:Ca2+/Na+ antiporter [Legionella sainthelensi]|uniref:Ca2+/Na+ antiporter n=1 Tax=Legionella sainthelensi TaxID=28087 RepID=A0A0W0YEB3_9GAMM|nr:sodium:calcium antiporter [Legionella sainthelensi]KTD55276.1 Ca2+/Na+ antiporter [Legionella sainthelensi]
MILALFLLFVSAIAIYISCEYFVNAIEWVGHKFNISKNATGTILAAFGTALPESVVTFVAVVFGNTPAQKEIGIGAAIGGPLVLSTIAYSIVGLTFFIQNHSRKPLISKTTELRLGHDQIWFMKIFVVKILLGLAVFSYKPWLGIGFLIAYAFYVKQEIQGTDDPEHLDFLEPLKIRPHDDSPSHNWALLQTLLSLIVIFISSHVFVQQLGTIGPALGLPPQMVALLLSPIATELPEILNAIIWVRQGKQILALANISGAMMIQATIPSALGIFFTPWILDAASLWGAVITLLSIWGLYLLLQKSELTSSRLSYFGLFYFLFAIGLFFI